MHVEFMCGETQMSASNQIRAWVVYVAGGYVLIPAAGDWLIERQ